MFPEKELDSVSSMFLNTDFLIYSTVKGSIIYFHLSDWIQLSGIYN
jgi:hypothetical protein